MDTDSQTRGGHAGCPFSAPNYKNNILIEIVERYLPQGLEAWREVALEYQREANEPTLRRGEDLHDNWNKKLCNRMQKPTGKPGALTERIFRCIAIERRIQDEATAAVLGIDSAESNHSRDDGSGSLSEIDVVAGGGGSSHGNAVPASRDGDDEGRSPVMTRRLKRLQWETVRGMSLTTRVILVHSQCLHLVAGTAPQQL